MPKNPIRLWSSCVFSIVVKTKEVSKIRKLLRCFEVCFPCCSCEISDNLPLADDCREVFCTIDIQGCVSRIAETEAAFRAFCVQKHLAHIEDLDFYLHIEPLQGPDNAGVDWYVGAGSPDLLVSRFLSSVVLLLASCWSSAVLLLSCL